MAYSAIDKAASFHSDNIWDGTGVSQTISCGFQPDMTWVKVRNQAYSNRVADSVRGYTKTLITNSTAAENASAGTVMSGTTADGFTVVSDSGSNESGNNYVGWSWKAGTTTGLSGGTITPTAYSFNTTAAQSVIAYTGNGVAGATIPHGLGVIPTMIIVKCLSTTGSWPLYHAALGATKYLELNTTSAEQTGTTRWNDTAPTSTLVSLGTTANVNGDTLTYVAYCFADVKGYSRMGSYEGSGDADGPFVYTGFKPSFVMIKNSSSVLNWTTRDNARDTFNPGYNYIYPNLNNAGTDIGPPATSGSYPVDFYSTGFKINNTDTKVNEAQSTFVYAAFGQTIVGTNGVVATAR